jgi:hypothetical protein
MNRQRLGFGAESFLPVVFLVGARGLRLAQSSRIAEVAGRRRKASPRMERIVRSERRVRHRLGWVRREVPQLVVVVPASRRQEKTRQGLARLGFGVQNPSLELGLHVSVLEEHSKVFFGPLLVNLAALSEGQVIGDPKVFLPNVRAKQAGNDDQREHERDRQNRLFEKKEAEHCSG